MERNPQLRKHALRVMGGINTLILSGLILEVLAERYPQVVTAEVASAWTKLLAIMCWKLSVTYNELGWIPGPGYQDQQHPDQHQHQHRDHDTTGSS
ncbi:hypothetical protein CRUP_000815 [Coryphaenoides rupestris]|nr:hypothetical protein CRUP_000815 [Coryphaenoides rupestris]